MTAPRTDAARENDEIPGPPLPRLGNPWSARVAAARGADLDLVHRWMARPHVAAFWHQAWTRAAWADELAAQRAGSHSLPCLIDRDGTPLAYVEIYRVARDRLAAHYPYAPHDLGVHIAIGDRDHLGRGLGRALLAALAHGLFEADPDCARVVAEPDERNIPSTRAFTAAGYRHSGTIHLPEKTARLLIHPRDTGAAPER
ncbi:GNAT family N-acetyltransferase [Streptomyces radicis]|uniref:Lysine N-acyltransferase MbtK n=1 Tax=Streptomyces radicis TaxID=1750517 RepID=A0A3A9W596_9ACTN|nr:GNAT family N-acetyltransferase [Streptomyces radicis]RKN08371.1 N-acetyltransferase [Streptomyces radicis]RKN21594.1 N-acetyltransferase [Streptomyces radicis]